MDFSIFHNKIGETKMIMNVTKKQQREDLKEMIRFVKENQIIMYNIILNLKRLKSEDKQ